MPFRIWRKNHVHYSWIKYNIYKPIRNFMEYYGYGYYLSDEELTKRRRKFIMGLKNETMERQ